MNKVWIVQRHIWIYLQHTRVKLIFQSMSRDANKEENLLAVLNFIQWKIKLLFMKSPGIKFAQYSLQNFKSYCTIQHTVVVILDDSLMVLIIYKWNEFFI